MLSSVHAVLCALSCDMGQCLNVLLDVFNEGQGAAEKSVHKFSWKELFMLLWWLFTRDQFWLPGIVVLASVCVCVCVRVCVHQPQACLHYNSSPLLAVITKFGSEVQNTLVKIHIVWGRLTLTFKFKFKLKSKFTPFWACLHDNASPFKLGSPNLDQRCRAGAGTWRGWAWQGRAGQIVVHKTDNISEKACIRMGAWYIQCKGDIHIKVIDDLRNKSKQDKGKYAIKQIAHSK